MGNKRDVGNGLCVVSLFMVPYFNTKYSFVLLKEEFVCIETLTNSTTWKIRQECELEKDINGKSRKRV